MYIEQQTLNCWFVYKHDKMLGTISANPRAYFWIIYGKEKGVAETYQEAVERIKRYII